MDRACVNHFLHSAVYQDGIWRTVFYQEERDDLTAVLQNEHLRVMYNLVNPDPILSSQSSQSIQLSSSLLSSVINREEEKEREESIQVNSEVVQTTEQSSSSSSSSCSTEQEIPIVSLKDLSLLYKITERQGWYVNKDGICYFIRFKDSTKKQYDVIFQDISNTDLDMLIRQVSSV